MCAHSSCVLTLHGLMLHSAINLVSMEVFLSHFPSAEWAWDWEHITFQHVTTGDIIVGGRVLLAVGTDVLLEKATAHVVAWL